MKKNKTIFGLDRTFVYWNLKTIAVSALIIMIWFVALPEIQTSLTTLTYFLNESLKGDMTNEFKFAIILFTLWLNLKVITIGLMIYDRVIDFIKEKFGNKVHQTEQRSTKK